MKNILIICCIVMLLSSCTGKLKKQINICESNVGKRVVLEKDTLLIIDYSMWNSTYILSNGKEIGWSLLEKIKIINE